MFEPEAVQFCIACGARMQEKLAFGRVRPVCPACGRIHFHEPKVAVAVLVEKDSQVLLVRRANSPEQGRWALPAGFIDAGELPEQAAARECLEETGLKVKITGLLDVIGGREHPQGADIVILYRGEVLEGQLTPGDDADALGYFSQGEMPPLAFEATRRALSHWLADR